MLFPETFLKGLFMISGSEMALDRAQIERSQNREHAIMAKASIMGYKFIRLQLKNIRKRRIVGVDCIAASAFVNEEMGGITDYNIEVKGGEINFQFRPDFAAYLFDILDTDRNRQFLASHYEFNYWQILDNHVDFDIKARFQKIKEDLIKKPEPLKAGSKEFWDEVHKAEEHSRLLARGEIEIPVATQSAVSPYDVNLKAEPIIYEPPTPEAVTNARPRGRPIHNARQYTGLTASERNKIVAEKKIQMEKSRLLGKSIIPTDPLEDVSRETETQGAGVNAP